MGLMRRSGFYRRSARLRSVSPVRRASGLGRRDDPVYQAVDRRAGERCEATLDEVRCSATAVDHHHVVGKRWGPGHAACLVVALCRRHHEQASAPMARGKLVIRPLGDGRFFFRVVVKPSKFHPDPAA